jgi:hypothetical protein
VLLRAGWLRAFDDGVALFDPVTWRTHVLAPDGFALLLELLQVAAESPGCDEPARLLARLAESAGTAEGAGTAESAAPAPPPPTAPMLELAAIALNLRAAMP